MYICIKLVAPYGEYPRVEKVSSSKNLITIIKTAKSLIDEADDINGKNPMIIPPKFKVVLEKSWNYYKFNEKWEDSLIFDTLEDILEVELDDSLLNYDKVDSTSTEVEISFDTNRSND